MRRFVLGLVLASGCADNAILEVDAALPARGECERFALIEARSGALPFDGDWGADARVVAAPLGQAESAIVFSIEADGGEIEAPLRLRARLCVDPGCDAAPIGACAGDATARALFVEVDRAFYESEFTHIAIDATEAGNEAGAVHLTRCEVAGCVRGTAASYCFEEGRHFCE